MLEAVRQTLIPVGIRALRQAVFSPQLVARPPSHLQDEKNVLHLRNLA